MTTRRKRTRVMKGCCKNKTKCYHKKKRMMGGCGTCTIGGGHKRYGCKSCQMKGGMGSALGFMDPYNNSNIFSRMTNGVLGIPQAYAPWW